MLNDMLENMEVLQVCFGEIEASLMDQDDILHDLQESTIRINKMIEKIRLTAKNGGNEPTLLLDATSLKGSLSILPNSARLSKDVHGTVSGMQAYVSGVLSWEVKILDVQRASTTFGPPTSNSLSLLLGVTSNPITATLDCHYDPNCIIFCVHDRKLFQGKRAEGDKKKGGGYMAETFDTPPQPAHARGFGFGFVAPAVPTCVACPFSAGEVFVVTLDCDSRKISIACRSWPSSISTQLPKGKAWYPHFSAFNTSFSIDLVDNTQRRR